MAILGIYVRFPGGVYIYPKTMKNKGFGHLKTRLFTIKTSKHVGFGIPWYVYIYTLEVQRTLKEWVFTKDYFQVGNFNHQKLGTIIFIVFDFQGIYIYLHIPRKSNSTKLCFLVGSEYPSHGSSSRPTTNCLVGWTSRVYIYIIWVVVSNIFYVHPYLGKIPILTNLTNIFQMGWNHQLVIHWCPIKHG